LSAFSWDFLFFLLCRRRFIEFHGLHGEVENNGLEKPELDSISDDVSKLADLVKNSLVNSQGMMKSMKTLFLAICGLWASKKVQKIGAVRKFSIYDTTDVHSSKKKPYS
jgi:hypothetical protein